MLTFSNPGSACLPRPSASLQGLLSLARHTQPRARPRGLALGAEQLWAGIPDVSQRGVSRGQHWHLCPAQIKTVLAPWRLAGDWLGLESRASCLQHAACLPWGAGSRDEAQHPARRRLACQGTLTTGSGRAPPDTLTTCHSPGSQPVLTGPAGPEEIG